MLLEYVVAEQQQFFVIKSYLKWDIIIHYIRNAFISYIYKKTIYIYIYIYIYKVIFIITTNVLLLLLLCSTDNIFIM